MSINADRIRSLRAAGDHDAALRLALELVRAEPTDAEVQYEVACLLDYRGEEAAPVEHYTAAIAAGLNDDLLRSAYLGLGSTYRALGSYTQALATLDEGLRRFPGALDLKVFQAMALYNAGHGKEAVEALLRVVVQSTSDVELAKYRGRSFALSTPSADTTSLGNFLSIRRWRSPRSPRRSAMRRPPSLHARSAAGRAQRPHAGANRIGEADWHTAVSVGRR